MPIFMVDNGEIKVCYFNLQNVINCNELYIALVFAKSRAMECKTQVYNGLLPHRFRRAQGADIRESDYGR